MIATLPSYQVPSTIHQSGDIKSSVFMMDCVKAMKEYPDKFFDLAVVDPNYGRKEHGGTDRTNNTVIQENGSSLIVKGNNYLKKDWDNEPAGDEYFNELLRVSKNQIIWGSNYYSKNFGSGRIIWDKVNEGSDQSDCEIAFNSLTERVDLIRYMWRGMFQGKSMSEGHVQLGNKKLNEKRIHPTQKPVILYDWIFKNYATPGMKILDTHLGSQSSRISAAKAKLDFTGFELDSDYFADGNKRFNEFISQTTIF